MLKFSLRRLGTGVILLFVVCTISFTLLSFGSENAARTILGVNATAQDLVRFNRDHGLDQPFLTQYWNWLSHAIRGDLGQPWSFSQTVSEVIGARLSVTLTLALVGVVVAGILSVLLGVAAALRGGWLDRLVQFLGLIGFAVPNFLIAFGLVTVFAVQHQIFNAVGWVPPTENFSEFFKSAALPVAALAFGALASVTQQVRGAVKDTLQLDFVRTLRTRGLSFNRVVFKHVLRNAGGPALSVLGLSFVGMLGGAVIIEMIFAIPGLGPFGVQATTQRDMPAVMGLVAVTAVIVIVVNLIVDLLSASLNPKVRLS